MKLKKNLKEKKVPVNDSGETVKERIQKSKSKFKMKKKLKILFVSLGVLAIIGVAILIISNHYKDLNKVSIEDYELYQYFGELRFDYKGKFSIKKNGEVTKIKYEGIDLETDSTPIYYKNIDNEIILPTNMALVFPRLVNKNYKLPYFSRLAIYYSENDSSAFLKLGKTKKYLENSFLYDGNNLYVFLYETKVTIDGKEYTLSPLSFISVNYKNDVSFYNKASDEYSVIDKHNDDVIANIDGYKVNLSTDMVLYDKDSKLLIKNVDSLQSYGVEK